MAAAGLKTVLIEPLWKLRQELNDLVGQSLDGYNFVTRARQVDKLVMGASRTNLAYHAHWALLRYLPVNLIKAYLNACAPLPSGIDLIYSVDHPILRKRPWVLHMSLEQPYLIIGQERVFRQWKWFLKPQLVSPHCKQIIYELEAGKKAFLQSTGWAELESKTTVVHPAVPSRHFTKAYASDENAPIRLLFVNSANINADKHFYTHGGAVLLEAFRRLGQRYSGLELVIRSNLPARVKHDLRQTANIRIIDGVLPWADLEREFATADIFVYPTHVTPSRVFLDAMSFELPIVTTDIWGNSEFVDDGRTGYLALHAGARAYTDGYVVHLDSPTFKRAVTKADAELVQAVVDKVGVLVEDSGLRRRMGRAGRREVEEGKFAWQRHREAMKRVLDRAMNSGDRG